MDETSKSKQYWGPLEHSVVTGAGIDIGCGIDPLPGARGFDVADGDANVITRFVKEQFDFVYSSHCLEHMHDPRKALAEWWQLVKPGGHLFFVIPDEDLYEQGVFPSRFNVDHKATFTVSKSHSWSPVSHNVLDLARELPNSELVSLALQDYGYDRRLMRHNQNPGRFVHFVELWYLRAVNHLGFHSARMEAWLRQHIPQDQTLGAALAQIQCIVRKTA